MSKHYAYIVLCSDNSLYCGYTNNLEKRLSLHNSGKASKYTRGRLPVKFAYIEEFDDKSIAMKRESSLKKLSSIDKRKLVSKNKSKTKAIYSMALSNTKID